MIVQELDSPKACCDAVGVVDYVADKIVTKTALISHKTHLDRHPTHTHIHIYTHTHTHTHTYTHTYTHTHIHTYAHTHKCKKL